MNSWYHSWIAAVRIARRDAWRSKGRSFLVLAMIALPIVGVSAADLTVRSADLSPEQKQSRQLGAADARFEGTGMAGAAILQAPDGNDYAPVGGYPDDRPMPDGPTDIPAAFPDGAKTLKETTGDARVRTRAGLLNTGVRELNAGDPLVKGMLAVDRGRFPTQAGEVAATTHFLDSAGLYVGSRLVVRGAEDLPLRIVGAYELPDSLDTDEVLAPQGTLLDRLEKELTSKGMRGVSPTSRYYVGVGGDGFTWNMVQQANAKGVLVRSRAVALDPPAESEVPLYREPLHERHQETSDAAKAEALAIGGTIVALAMLEICLLAGPAFAVGARRSRRQLGLVGANGGDRRHIRAIVLSGGLVIGAAAAVVGTTLGIALTFALQPVLEEKMGQRFGGFDLRPLELLGIAALAVLTGLLAAVVPAITASRQTVLASLTGRRGVRRANRVLPVLGLVAVAAGVAVALYGTTVSGDGFLFVAGGSGLAELGVVALTPVLVGLFGRTGRWLPLSPRLALRDAVRNRGRTAPAVAAVLAAVAGTVAVATYAESSDAESRHAYVAQLPDRSGMFTTTEPGAFRDLPAVRAALEKELPVSVRADVSRILVGRADCDVWSMDKGCGSLELVTPKANDCLLYSVDDPMDLPEATRRKWAADWRCANDRVYTDQPVVVADAKLLTALNVHDPVAERTLREGGAITFDRQFVQDGKVTLVRVTDQKKADEAANKHQDAPGLKSAFRVHQVKDPGYGIKVVLSPAAAKSAGLKTLPYGTYFTLDQRPSSEQSQRFDGALDKIGTELSVHIEKGYTSKNNIVLLALTVFAGLITIGAAGIATGLAQADAEADLKTLAAVGAPPRVRRTLSGFQCGVVAVMGVLLGSAAGVLPAIGLRLSQRHERTALYQEALRKGWGMTSEGAPWVPVMVPWTTLAVLLVAVPLGAALLATLLTRSSGALARRAAG
ncbi:ABC transporter permease [Streptomyces sp. NPDC089919]|uniref:ABC transporter permease n=1 Tax=Streptomyces sp. NPDC089919 TaxID=3155188 RepID=UPI00342EC204